MRFKNTYGTGREKFQQNFILLTNQILLQFYNCYHGVLIKGISLSLLPTIAIGCSTSVLPQHDTDGKSAVTKTLTSPFDNLYTGGTLDILVFNDDKLQRLDSYQRVERFEGTAVHPTSTGGQKIIFMQYGSENDRYQWAEINSYGTLRKMTCRLEDESIDSPVMTGHCRCDAGESEIPIRLTPLSGRIVLKTLGCDFSGTPYEGEAIHDVKAYLTNVITSCRIIPESSNGEQRMINCGMLNRYDLHGFRDKSIIEQHITDLLNESCMQVEADFLCYPNSNDKSRPTRMVLEGKIAGTTYYWPIEIGDGNGTERGMAYVYDILIRRKGTTDPDVPIELKDMEINLNVKPWTEKEDYRVRF